MIAVWSAVVYVWMYMVNLRSRWGRIVYYESTISRVRVWRERVCLLPTSTIIVIIFFYAYSVQVFYTAILYWFNTVLIIIPQDSITRGWAAQRIGGWILCAEPSEFHLEMLHLVGLVTWGFITVPIRSLNYIKIGLMYVYALLAPLLYTS